MSGTDLFREICKEQDKGQKIVKEIKNRIFQNGGWHYGEFMATILLCGKKMPDVSIKLPEKQPLNRHEIAIRADEDNHLLIKVNGLWWQTKSAIKIQET